jgi:hypothetical protein
MPRAKREQGNRKGRTEESEIAEKRRGEGVKLRTRKRKQTRYRGRPIRGVTQNQANEERKKAVSEKRLFHGDEDEEKEVKEKLIPNLSSQIQYVEEVDEA